MKVALAQINTTVGDLAGNEAKIVAAYQKAQAAGVELVIFPELTTTGYPPRDLLLKKNFVAQNLEMLDRLAGMTGNTAMLLGYVADNKDRPGKPLRNNVALLQNGKILGTRIKTLLPTYDVFDEDRYFEPAEKNEPFEFEGVSLGLTVCEDIWNDEDFWPDRRYRRNPPMELIHAGARILFNVSASPWHLKKNKIRHEMLSNIARKAKAPVVFCNAIGGNDEVIFDGGSMVFNAKGELVAKAAIFAEDFVVADTDSQQAIPLNLPSDEEKLFRALVLGLRDYFHKCGFKSAVLGLSGGIDSAVTAVLAAEALGRENVHGISLPSEFSSQHSLDDARALAENLGIKYDVLPIQTVFAAMKQELKPLFGGRPEDTAEENLQARIRGNLLMAVSNKFGSLLLTTGNKSELAVGYCTLYGDMAGGLAVISDVPKTLVYNLARWMNREREIIPVSSITKAP
ncbi:MAG: NAD+ synthase, partial [Limisphaerales bacterium]